MKRLWPYIVFAVLFVAVLVFPEFAPAQTFSQVAKGDTMLLITRAVQCQKASTCPDSVFVDWEIGRDTKLHRVFKTKGTDTARVKRGLTGGVAATPYYGEFRRTKGTTLTIPSMPVDSLTEVALRDANGRWMVSNSRDIQVSETDTLLFVRFLRLANGMRIRPTTVEPWRFTDASILRIAKANALQDSIWVISK